MLQMIIVDDERIIRESLSKFIDWGSVGVKVIGTADNGTAAVDLVLKKQPDIVLSDIAMPNLNGIQMIELLRRHNFETEIIFISAYSSFEYAKNALKYGAFDYILKPINETQLLETVGKCVKKINAAREKEQLMDQAARESEKKLRNLLCNLLCEGRTPSPEEAIALEECGLSGEAYPLMIAAGLWYQSPFSEEDTLALDISSYPRSHRAFLMPVSSDQQILLLFSADHDNARLHSDFTRLMQQRRDELPLCIHLEYLSVSRAHSFSTGFSKLFTELCLPLSAAGQTPCPGVLQYDKIPPPAEGQSCEQLFSYIVEQMKLADISGVARGLRELFLSFNAEGLIYDIDIIKLKCIELVDFAIKGLQDYHLQEYVWDSSKNLSSKKNITCQKSIDQVFMVTKNLLKNLTSYIEDTQKKSSKRLISLTLQYIHDNYNKDITLAQAAQHLYVSPTYLSKVFSTEMQQPFSHYLLTYRIEMAKNLLRDPQYKVYEVAKQVGYADGAHFSKTFKQITGLSPNQYKNR